MKLDLGLEMDGGWIVDPRDLAQKLGVSATALERSVIDGSARVAFISGIWTDVGDSQVTVHLYDGGWKGTFDRSGQLVAEHVW